MASERHRIPLNETLLLQYQRQKQASSIEACYAFPIGYASGKSGLWHALFRLWQQQLPEGWHSTVESTPDWTFFSFQTLPENREAFYQIIQAFRLESLSQESWSSLQPSLLQEARFAQSQPENLFETAFFALAFPQTGYASAKMALPQDFESISFEQLLEAHQSVFAQGTVYLKLSDNLPLPRLLQTLAPLIENQASNGLEPEAFQLNSQAAIQETLEHPVPGGWVWQGFRVPGLLNEQWMHGLVLQYWFEQVMLLEGLPECIDSLQCRWLPWMKGGLLYLVYHVPQASDLEKAKFHLLEWLLQAREGYLTPRRLRKAIHACHSDWLQGLNSKSESAMATRIEEFLHGSSRFKNRLQAVSLDSLKAFWRQYLHADNLVTLEIMHGSTRKQRYRSYREHFPVLGYRPTLTVPPHRAAAKLTTNHKVELGQGSFARLLPLPQANTICLGAWFDQGSRHERMPGSYALLFSLLAQRFDRLLQQQDSSGAYLATHTLHWQVDRDYCGFYWHAPAHEYRQALLLFRQLLELTPPEKEWVERCKHQLLAQCQRQQLSIQAEAKQRFYQSGFGNHAYSLPPTGDYYSLQALSLEDVEQAWQDLFASLSFNPLLVGALPQELVEGILPELLSRPITLENSPERTEKPLLLRRGEIQMPFATNLPLRLEGRIFAEPLPQSELAPIILLSTWLKNSLERMHPGVGQFDLTLLKKAWLYHIRVPDTPESYLWRTQLSESQLPEFDSLRQNAAFYVRHLKQNLLQLWPLLAQWEALGYGAASLLDLDKELLVLAPHQVDASLKKWFGDRQEWLQIRMRAER
jgi:predicted Zn-dependent peptidase